MKQHVIEAFVEALENVQRDDSSGYIMYFVGDDHLLPFVTIAHSDQEGDNVSQLYRPGVFRVNIGISSETYKMLIGDSSNDVIDYATLNTFLPHPHYSQYNFICILNPINDQLERTKKLIIQSHSIATEKLDRQQRVIEQQGLPKNTLYNNNNDLET